MVRTVLSSALESLGTCQPPASNPLFSRGSPHRRYPPGRPVNDRSAQVRRRATKTLPSTDTRPLFSAISPHRYRLQPGISVISRQGFKARPPLIRVDMRECICGRSGQPNQGSRPAGARSLLRYRLGINSRTALVRYAIEAGLLPPKDRTT